MLTRKDMGEVLVNTARVTEVFPSPSNGTMLRFEAIGGEKVKQLAVLNTIDDVSDMLGAPEYPARTNRGATVRAKMAAARYN